MPAPRKPAAVRQDNRKTRSAKVVALPAVRSKAPPLPVPKPLKATTEVWESYWQSDLAGSIDLDSDGSRLLRWITYIDEWHRALNLFRRNRIVEGSMGQPRVNPIWKTLVELEGHIAKAEQELGLTPLARVKLGIKFAEAQLTVKDLNKALEETDRGDEDDESLLAEWGQA